MPLSLTRRGQYWYLRGTVRGPRKTRVRVFESTGQVERALAEQVRQARETQLVEELIYGKRAVISFRQCAESYLKKEPRSQSTIDYIDRLVAAIGHKHLGVINRELADEQCEKLLKKGAGTATKRRGIFTPLSAVLMHGYERQWCNPPNFGELPALPDPETPWLTPDQVLALIAAAAPHIKPLITFLVCTGARMSEALDLEWRDVDLPAAKVVLRKTKGKRGRKKDRPAALPTAAVVALSSIPPQYVVMVEPGTGGRQILKDFPSLEAAHDAMRHEAYIGEWTRMWVDRAHVGKVFRRDDGEPYADRQRLSGDQIGTAWRGACQRAGLPGEEVTVVRKHVMKWHRRDGTTGELRSQGPTAVFKPKFTPHDLRHTWASYFYLISKDPILLRDEGGWSSVKLVERYAHLMPSALTGEIAKVWGAHHPKLGALPVTNPVQSGEGAAETASA